MSWKTVNSNSYYYHNFKEFGKVRTWYVGRGPSAAAIACCHGHARDRRARARLKARELVEAGRRLVEADRRRIIHLGEIIDRAMVAAGYYKHKGTYRRRGVVTMRTLRDYANDPNLSMALRRESARRHFATLDGDELTAEIDQYAVDVEAIAAHELVAKVTGDPMQQEATLRRLDRAGDELAGPDPSPLVRLLARTVPVLTLERDVASVKSRRVDAEGMPSSSINKDLWKIRDFVERRLNAAIRTLAYVRRVEQSAIRQAVDRLRIAG
jgi:hypothetical protein